MSQNPTPQPGLCNSCPFWDLLHNSAVTAGGPIVQSGLCRKNSPVNIDWNPDRPQDEDAEPVFLPPTVISGIRPGMFPTTRGNDWCAEHPLRVALAELDVDAYRVELKERRKAIEKAKREADRSAPAGAPTGGSAGSRQ